MLRANFLQFIFCMMNIQCFLRTVRMLLCSILHFMSTKKLRRVFGFLPEKMCRNIRLSVSLMKVMQHISSLQVVVMSYSCIRLASCPLVNWGMITSCSFRINNTGQTHHPEYALETLGTNDMWHAIMQIIKVNMTHFPSHERQFLSHSPNQLRHFHCITSGVCVSKDFLCRADRMTTG